MTETDTSKPTRRRWRFWTALAVGLVVLVLAALLLVRVLAATPFGRGMVENEVEGQTVSGQSIELEGLKGDLFSDFSIDTIYLSDEDGRWGELSDVELNWKPGALIGRKLTIRALDVGTIHILRRPELVRSETSDSGGDFPLKGIRLDRIGLDRIDLEEGVVPNKVTASADGAVRWTPDAADIDFELRPGDDEGDRLIADIGWSDDLPLNGRFDLNGPAGGLFASLLRLEPDQAVSAQFETEQFEDGLGGNGEARIAGEEWLALSIEPKDVIHEVHADIRLSAHPMSREFADRLGDQIAVDFGLDLKADEELVFASVSAETLQADLQDIRLSDENRSMEIVLLLKQPDALIPGDAVSMANARFSGELSEAGDGYRFEGNLLASDLRSEQASVAELSGPLQARFEDNVLSLDFTQTGSALSLQLRDPVRLSSAQLNAQLDYNLDESALTLRSARLKTPRSTLTARGTLTTGDRLTFDLQGDTQAHLAELGLYDAGIVRGNWQVSQASNTRRDFRLDLNGQQFASAEDALNDWIGSGANLKARGSQTPDGMLLFDAITLNTDAVKLIANGDAVPGDAFNLSGTLETSETYPLAEVLPGLGGEFTLGGRADDMTISAQLAASQAGTGRNSLNAPALAFDGNWAEGRLQGKARLQGQLEGSALTVSTNTAYADGRWSAQDLTGNWQDLSLTGELSGEGGALETIVGQLRLEGDLPDSLPAEAVAFDISVSDARVRADGDIADVSLSSFPSGDVALSASGTRELLDFSIAYDGVSTLGVLNQPASFTLEGQAQTPLEPGRHITGSFVGEIGAERIETVEPFSVKTGPDGLEAMLELAALEGRLSVEAVDGRETPLTVSASDISLRPTMLLLGRAPMDGRADLDLIVRQQDEGAMADLSGQIRQLAVPGRDIDPVDFNIRGQFDEQAGRIEVRTPDGQLLQSEVDLDLPLGAQLSAPYLSWQGEQTGAFAARLNGPIDNMSAILLPGDLILEGKLNADMAGEIPFTPASFSGNMTFREGVFQHQSLGADLQNITFDLTAEASQLNLADFSAEGRTGGTLAGRGSLDLANGVESSVSLKADRLSVINRKEFQAVASGTLGLDVVEERFEIIGDLVLDEGRVRIDALPSGTGPTLDVRFEEEPEEQTPERKVTLDIAVTAPHSLKITGQGMDAEFALDTRITGTSAEPVINGSARIVRGRFDLLGKRFSFGDSSISFTGDPMDAQLDILAVRDTDDFQARVEITGTPERPSVSLSADPELPEDEVLSRVLFGRSPSQLSGLEAARLAAALASLSGGGGFDLMGGIENITGLDSVDVSQSESGDFRVATGRYLTDDIYLELSSGGAGQPGVSVEWEARDNISVEAESAPDEGQTLSVQWKRDFD